MMTDDAPRGGSDSQSNHDPIAATESMEIPVPGSAKRGGAAGAEDARVAAANVSSGETMAETIDDRSVAGQTPGGVQLSGDELAEIGYASDGPSSGTTGEPRAGRRVDISGSLATRVGYEKFELGGLLGKGGMGTVHNAVDMELRRQLAIKRPHAPCDASRAMRFIEEAQITAQLAHPGIVAVHELGCDDNGRPWLAMKRIEGEGLDKILSRQRQLPPQRASYEEIGKVTEVGIKLCEAIGYAHARGVLHRDLKPSNVMIGAYGEVVVMDWGLATLKPLHTKEEPSSTGPHIPPRMVQTNRKDGSTNSGVPDSGVPIGATTNDIHATRDGKVLGTLAYLPPEQARGELSTLDERADVFGVGAILYEMLTLESPHSDSGSSQQKFETWERATRGRVIPPRKRKPSRGIPQELAAIVERAMAAGRDDRYRTASALAEDLRAYRDSRPTVAFKAPLPVKIWKWSNRRPRLSVAVAIILFGIALAITIRSHVRGEIAENRQRIAEQDRQAKEDRMRLLIEQNKLAELREYVGANVASRHQEFLAEMSNQIQAVFEDGPERILLLEDVLDRIPRSEQNRFTDIANEAINVREQYGVEIDPRLYLVRGLFRLKDNFDVYGAIEDYRSAREIAKDRLDRDGAGMHERVGSAEMTPHEIAEVTYYASFIHEGIAHLWAGRHERAVQELTVAIDADEPMAMPLFARGRAYLQLGRLGDARDDFEAARSIVGGDSRLTRYLGEVYMLLSRDDLAIEFLSRWLAQNDNDAWAYQLRAIVHARLGETDAALTDVAAAEELVASGVQMPLDVGWQTPPTRATVTATRAFVDLIRAGTSQNAAESSALRRSGLDHARRAIELDPDQWLAWFARGMGLAQAHIVRRLSVGGETDDNARDLYIAANEALALAESYAPSSYKPVVQYWRTIYQAGSSQNDEGASTQTDPEEPAQPDEAAPEQPDSGDAESTEDAAADGTAEGSPEGETTTTPGADTDDTPPTDPASGTGEPATE